MRCMVTDIDSQGRSRVVSDGVVEYARREGSRLASARLATIEQCPPELGPRGGADVRDVGTPAGAVHWIMIDFPPDGTIPIHHTDTVDYAVVVEGRIELTLDDGTHQLGPGDCVVLEGGDHAWRAGADGCRMSMVCIGAVRAP